MAHLSLLTPVSVSLAAGSACVACTRAAGMGLSCAHALPSAGVKHSLDSSLGKHSITSFGNPVPRAPLKLLSRPWCWPQLQGQARSKPENTPNLGIERPATPLGDHRCPDEPSHPAAPPKQPPVGPSICHVMVSIHPSGRQGSLHSPALVLCPSSF